MLFQEFFKDFRTESKRLSGINRIRINWGVEQYPEGADWSGPVEEKRNVRNAIGVMIFLEMKIRKADRFSYLTSPIFSLIPREKERPGKAYLANYWQKGGRYFCISCNGNVGEFISEMDIPNTFKDQFGFDPPPITGIAIDADATNTSSKMEDIPKLTSRK